MDWDSGNNPTWWEHAGSTHYFILAYIEQTALAAMTPTYFWTVYTNHGIKTYTNPSDPSDPANGLYADYGANYGVTGYAANATMRSEFLEPGMDLMTKPFTFDGLSQKIRQLLER